MVRSMYKAAWKNVFSGALGAMSLSTFLGDLGPVRELPVVHAYPALHSVVELVHDCDFFLRDPR